MSASALLGGSEGVDSGTTIIACTYNGGVILGADSRTSTGEFSLDDDAVVFTRAKTLTTPLTPHTRLPLPLLLPHPPINRFLCS
jgi:hypothetical protein